MLAVGRAYSYANGSGTTAWLEQFREKLVLWDSNPRARVRVRSILLGLGLGLDRLILLGLGLGLDQFCCV